MYMVDFPVFDVDSRVSLKTQMNTTMNTSLQDFKLVHNHTSSVIHIFNMHIYIYICTHYVSICMYVCLYVCMDGWMYACMHAGMYNVYIYYKYNKYNINK